MNDAPFFIIGSKRGGTTLLRMMLNSHPDLGLPPESHFLIPILKRFKPTITPNQQERQEIANHIFTGGRFETWQTTEGEIIELFDQLAPKTTLAALIDAVFQLEISKHSKSKWGEKTPEYIDIIDDLALLYPKAKFIFLVRDGRDVINSLKSKGWEGWSIYQRGNYWNKCVNAILNFPLAHPNPSLLIKYEELVLQTEQTLRKICLFLDIPFKRSMLDYYKTAHQHITATEKEANIHNKLSRLPSLKDLHKWKRTDPAQHIFLGESIMYRALKATGYDLDQYKARNPIHALRGSLYQIYGELSTLLYQVYHHYLPIGLKESIKGIQLGKRLRKVVRSS